MKFIEGSLNKIVDVNKVNFIGTENVRDNYCVLVAHMTDGEKIMLTEPEDFFFLNKSPIGYLYKETGKLYMKNFTIPDTPGNSEMFCFNKKNFKKFTYEVDKHAYPTVKVFVNFKKGQKQTIDFVGAKRFRQEGWRQYYEELNETIPAQFKKDNQNY